MQQIRNNTILKLFKIAQITLISTQKKTQNEYVAKNLPLRPTGAAILRFFLKGSVPDKGRWFSGKGKTSFHEKRSRNVGSGIFSLPLSAVALCEGGNPFQEKRSIL